MRLVVADTGLRDRIQDATFGIWNEGLTRAAFGRWNDGQMRTAWGREHLHRLALLDGRGSVLASMKRFRFSARYDGEAMPVLGIGAVFTMPEHRGRGYAMEMLERVVAGETAAGAGAAALFSEFGDRFYGRLGFRPAPVD
jgi:GNAT superfamily N-acetyltransferase